MALPPICAVVAMCKPSKGIGFRGDLPWGGKLPKELKHFSRITSNTADPSKQNAVIMGRRTWDSIPKARKPLPRRLNIVLSTTMTPDSLPKDVLLAKSFDEALLMTQQIGSGDSDQKPIETLMVIGGSQVYATALEHASMDRLYLTEISSNFECDTFLQFDEHNFVEVEDATVTPELQEENGIEYRFRVLKKIHKK